jgi:hypothetical protein
MVRIMSSSRKLTKSYGMATTKIVAAVAILGIIVVFSVAIGLKATEPPLRLEENLWFKFSPKENVNITSMLATVYIYDLNFTLIEQFLLLNTTSWQSSENLYMPGLDVVIFIDFWDIAASVDNVIYRIGRSPIVLPFDHLMVTILSDWSEPMF